MKQTFELILSACALTFLLSACQPSDTIILPPDDTFVTPDTLPDITPERDFDLDAVPTPDTTRLIIDVDSDLEIEFVEIDELDPLPENINSIRPPLPSDEEPGLPPGDHDQL